MKTNGPIARNNFNVFATTLPCRGLSLFSLDGKGLALS